MYCRLQVLHMLIAVPVRYMYVTDYCSGTACVCLEISGGKGNGEKISMVKIY